MDAFVLCQAVLLMHILQLFDKIMVTLSVEEFGRLIKNKNFQTRARFCLGV